MKKILFLASVFVAGAATVGFAQLSEEKNNEASVNGIHAINYQDTTKPVKDSIPEKKDSTSIKF